MDQMELKRRVDEILSPDFEKLAIRTLKEQGPKALDALVDTEIMKYRARWTAAEPAQVTPEGLALREGIRADLTERLKTGSTTLSPGLSETEAEWRRDPELRKEFLDHYEAYAAYKQAIATGRARIFAGNKIIRGEGTHEG